MMLELAVASLLIFLPLVGACEPGLALGGRWWAMVGQGGRLVAETDEEATDERPCHLPAWGGGHPSKLLGFVSTCTHWILSIDPSLGIQPKYETFFLNLCLSIQTKSRVS